MTFLGEIFFLQKCLNFCMCFSILFSNKTFPWIFLLLMFSTLFLRKTRTKHRSVHNERNKVEQEKTIFSSIVSMCWCGASDKSVITQWIIFLEHWFKSWTFPLVFFFLSVALLFNFFLLTRKTYCRFKPPNNASQIRWFNAGFDIFLHLTTRLGWLFFF